jgi:hypothetical protein
MNDDQFERLINGISLIAAETQISNIYARFAAMGEEPENPYYSIGAAYALADEFRKKINNWGLEDFEIDEWSKKAFPR